MVVALAPAVAMEAFLVRFDRDCGAGTLDSLPHNGAVVTLLAVCNSTHRESYMDIVMVSIVGGLLALAAVIVLRSTVRSF